MSKKTRLVKAYLTGFLTIFDLPLLFIRPLYPGNQTLGSGESGGYTREIHFNWVLFWCPYAATKISTFTECLIPHKWVNVYNTHILKATSNILDVYFFV